MELYGINAVSRDTGIHPSSLRRWEGLGLFKPDRVDLGMTTVRVYTPEHVDYLLRVKDLIDRGVVLRTAFEWAETEEETEVCGNE